MTLTDLKKKPREYLVSYTSDLAFSPNNKFIACAVSDGTTGFVEILDVLTGRRKRKLSFGDKPVSYVIYSPNGKLIVAIHYWVDPDGRMRGDVSLWDSMSGKLLQTLGGGKRDIGADVAVFSPDGKTLACNGQGYVMLWSIKDIG